MRDRIHTVTYYIISLFHCSQSTLKDPINGRNSQRTKIIEGRKRVARMLLSLAILFAISWMPYHSIQVTFLLVVNVTSFEYIT